MCSCNPSKPSDCSSTATCESDSIIWEKQPGATDEDLKKAQQMWDDAKKRRLPDGSKPETVKAMEALESSDNKTTIKVGPNGNNANPDSWADAEDPTKGSDATINFNPDKKGTYGDGVERDPESSLAHEAYHAYEMTHGLEDEDDAQGAETRAANAENQHRHAKGIEQRKKYGPWDLEESK